MPAGLGLVVVGAESRPRHKRASLGERTHIPSYRVPGAFLSALETATFSEGGDHGSTSGLLYKCIGVTSPLRERSGEAAVGIRGMHGNVVKTRYRALSEWAQKWALVVTVETVAPEPAARVQVRVRRRGRVASRTYSWVERGGVRPLWWLYVCFPTKVTPEGHLFLYILTWSTYCDGVVLIVLLFLPPVFRMVQTGGGDVSRRRTFAQFRTPPQRQRPI